MPIVNYPFLRYSPKDVERPMLFIKVTNPQTGLVLDSIGIIDTGADACAVPARYARILGYDVKSGTPKPMGTGAGLTTAYTHQCRLDIYDTYSIIQRSAKVVYTTSEIDIDFMEKLPIILLGVKDFLGQFFLGIDYRAKLFSLRFP
jgi:hypothetical protein